ncbi:MAG TPA: PIN domain-containing protein [Rhodoblastus sp.]|nr:PIN domain-containing protein [Rhodoblastus sp.]
MARFLDTNILIYAIGGDEFAPKKTALARKILDEGDCALSIQVFQEFYVQATRESRRGAISHDIAITLLKAWSRFPLQSMTRELFDEAINIKARHRLSYWDAAIVAAAQALGCETLYSEDMADGMTIGGTTIVNPFR